MRKYIIAIFVFLFCLHVKAQDYKPYLDILMSQWRLTDTLNDTTIFYKDTLVLTRKYTSEIAHHASFFFKEGYSLQVYFGCHTYPEEPGKEYCIPGYGQWEFVDPKNMNLAYVDIGIYRSYKIENLSDQYMTLVMKK